MSSTYKTMFLYNFFTALLYINSNYPQNFIAYSLHILHKETHRFQKKLKTWNLNLKNDQIQVYWHGYLNLVRVLPAMGTTLVHSQLVFNILVPGNKSKASQFVLVCQSQLHWYGNNHGKLIWASVSTMGTGISHTCLLTHIAKYLRIYVYIFFPI